MEPCRAEGCTRIVSKPGHQLCLDHWKAERAGRVRACDRCGRWHEQTGTRCRACAAPTTTQPPPVPPSAEDDSPAGYLSSTKIGKHFGLSNIKMNLILAELGWIEKYVKGWIPTDRGNALGANVKTARNGVPYTVWPESILANAALRASVTEQAGAVPALTGAPKPAAATTPDPSADFRGKFPATFRTQDGHMVRSRAEVLIDNWLYMQGLVHAYERRLPIEEECYCDFYLPGGKGVYIEFWGRESNPKKRAQTPIYFRRDIRGRRDAKGKGEREIAPFRDPPFPARSSGPDFRAHPMHGTLLG